jgi:hypothetical protein
VLSHHFGRSMSLLSTDHLQFFYYLWQKQN